MEDYKEIKEMLKPRRDIKASEELRNKVDSALERKGRKQAIREWTFGGIGLSAVAAILIFVLIPSGMSATEVLAEAIKALGETEYIEMTVDIRTRPVENFGYIGINEDFVAHNIYIADSDSLLKWRIDKGERVATGNGSDIYVWLPSLKLGMHLSDVDNERVLGYMSTLLTPGKVLETELYNCTSGDGAEYMVNKKGSEIILTVHAAPQGNFENPYLLNTSISESENIRRYVIDADTKRLKSATVSVISRNREITVLDISVINYGRRKDDICRLADGIRYVETENQLVGLTGLSAEESALIVLNAFANWDSSILDKVMPREISDIAYKEKFSGSRLISIGRSFTSGTGRTIFIPYTLELRNGSIHRHNIALQETYSGGWIVTGGL
ncbi:hypothetical protein [Xylanibacter rodentium]|uniref:hypothetical protein n=1 Tax=Xylanibacter rodentium TaxID=2736289 RepID=UPI002597B554|nr:hypothetical protein [Xylanibacter rodentium]